MKLLPKTILALLLSFSFLSLNQPYKFTLISKIPFNSSQYWDTDMLGNIYVWDKSQLTRYSPDGKAEQTYNRNDKIPISLVDVQNPLRIAVFTADNLKIQFLDKSFNPVGNEINLAAMGYTDVPVVCSSANNGFWMFDNNDKQLLRYNSDNQLSQQSGNLQVLLSTEVAPKKLLEQNNTVYMENTDGIMVFDAYATHLRTIALNNYSSFQVIGESIFYYKDKKFKAYNFKTMQERSITLPDTNAIAVRMGQQRLYLQKKDAIEIYLPEF